ncbi:ABC transporter permease [Spongiactinospora rosea]|uniref:Transport permease protein n=1 Tax=Spongiactinospora rosea TaxID=2248750 RepID=A0A366M841_9ACTN|nr:ABC transporter permease [Spongiactinospora rosea]RBQ21890.1 ABC transporter permease [Spongiactinospora rosea]
MSGARAAAYRAGFQRGGIELRQNLTSFWDVWGAAGPALIAVVVMFVLRGNTVPGTTFSLGSQAVPGIIAMNVAFICLNLAAGLTVDREDGTLLRAKAIPDGMTGYLVGKVLTSAGMATVSVLIVLIPSAFAFDGLDLRRVPSWLVLAGVLALGLVAMIPVSAILGSMFNSAQSLGIVMLPVMGLVAVSGVFYPITGFPVWLQWLAQVFPIYWLGLGMRSALLPDGLAAAEIGASFRPLETVVVLGVWAVAGLLVAPGVLRRMARRESGSAVAARKEKAMRRPM